MSNFAALSKSSQVTSDANENLRLYAMLGDITPVQHAMIQGANIDDADPVEGNTALLEAARSGHTDMVAELLRCAPLPAGHRENPSRSPSRMHTHVQRRYAPRTPQGGAAD